jgi:hypothetical protein
MFLWYSQAEVCYAYLSDVTLDSPDFKGSRWFTRGWTLQELIAPVNVVLYDSSWNMIGTKHGLSQKISELTGINRSALDGTKLDQFSVATRMSWAAKRKTSRKEDEAYCLLGLFNVNMPLLYGERERAFLRLQQEIFKYSRDESIFAWGIPEDFNTVDPSEVRDSIYRFQAKFVEQFFPELNSEPPKPIHLYGYFAPSPEDFQHCRKVVHLQQNGPQKLIRASESVGDDLALGLPTVHMGRISQKLHLYLCLLCCKIENVGSMICLLILRPQEGYMGRTRIPVAVLLHQWGTWTYGKIYGDWPLSICSNSIWENRHYMLTISIDAEQLCRTTGYHLTRSHCISTASLINSTKIQLSESPEGRQSILLFEPDKSFGDPFVVTIGIFNKTFGNYSKTSVFIRVQWVPRTHDPVQFMKKTIAQPLLTGAILSGAWDKQTPVEMFELSVNAEGQLLDEAIIHPSKESGQFYQPIFWYKDVELYPPLGQSDIIRCSIGDSLLSDLRGLSNEHSLRIESIKKPGLDTNMINWAADPYDYLTLHRPRHIWIRDRRAAGYWMQQTFNLWKYIVARIYLRLRRWINGRPET